MENVNVLFRSKPNYYTFIGYSIICLTSLFIEIILMNKAFIHPKLALSNVVLISVSLFLFYISFYLLFLLLKGPKIVIYNDAIQIGFINSNKINFSIISCSFVKKFGGSKSDCCELTIKSTWKTWRLNQHFYRNFELLFYHINEKTNINCTGNSKWYKFSMYCYCIISGFFS